MKFYPILLTLIICLVNTQAKCDHITVNGQSMSVNSVLPFESYPAIKDLREKLKDYGTQCTEDGCSFSAEWAVINKALVLTGIHSCECNSNRLTANLNNIFKGQIHHRVLKATWFTGKLWLTAVTEKPVAYIGISPLQQPIYSKETCLNVNKGVVIGIEDHVYPKPAELIYYKNIDSLNKFIYTHINWNNIEDLPQKSKMIFFYIQPDSTGHPIEITIDENYPETKVPDQSRVSEAKRVVNLMKWPVYYYHGKILKYHGMITNVGIEFSKEMMEKYRNTQ